MHQLPDQKLMETTNSDLYPNKTEPASFQPQPWLSLAQLSPSLFYSKSIFKKDRVRNVTVVPVREQKSSAWQDEIVQTCVDSLISGTIPNPKVNI